MNEEKRKPVEIGGRTLYLSAAQRRFKARKVRLTQQVKVYSFMSVTVLKPGTVLETRPLYSGALPTALSGDGKEVYVSLGRNSSCWIPEGRWETIRSREARS